MKKNGFTLIELLVVIAVIATIIAFAVPNFLGARQRANDTRKKAEMIQLKNALRLYYNDYNRYPDSYSSFPIFNSIKGCDTNGDQNCPKSGCTVDFAAGGTTGCEVIYMKKFPTGFGSNTMNYCKITGGDDFRLWVTLENYSDSDLIASQARCHASNCKTSWSATEYVICAD